jgi:hypothetical protein
VLVRCTMLSEYITLAEVLGTPFPNQEGLNRYMLTEKLSWYVMSTLQGTCKVGNIAIEP